ncbi:unnamed protein product [Porites evermanni]|uniref:Uncharacterized protein n=1 Tax=Porites evermanni TaxID=104178 RepID=A0ABN8SMW1_9CNID|nr:unnamed protein product [Porites evermanni]
MFIGDYTLKAVEDFSYLGSIISSNLSLDTELNKRTGQAAAKDDLGQHHVDHQQQDETRPGPSTPTKTFHLRCLRRILGITWRDCVPNKDVVA